MFSRKYTDFRALQKESEKTAWLNFVPFIELDKKEAEEMLQKEMKVIDTEINNARNALRKAAKVWFQKITAPSCERGGTEKVGAPRSSPLIGQCCNIENLK